MISLHLGSPLRTRTLVMSTRSSTTCGGGSNSRPHPLSYRTSGTSLILSEDLLSNTIGDFRKVMLGDPGTRTVELLLLSVRLSMPLSGVCSTFTPISGNSRSRHHKSAMLPAFPPPLDRSQQHQSPSHFSRGRRIIPTNKQTRQIEKMELVNNLLL